MYISGAPMLSIIIPAHNEADCLASTLKETKAFLDLQPYVTEIIIVDDGSTDSTATIAATSAETDLRIRTVLHPDCRGKGCAVRSGMRVARGRYLIFMDADLSYSLHHIEDILSEFDWSHDIVIGSRALPASRAAVAPPKGRRMASKLLASVVQTLGLSGFRDTQCGLKGFTRDAAEQIFSRQRISGFAFDIELLHIAKRLNLSVQEIPVVLRHSSRSSVRPVRDGLALMGDLFAIWWRGVRKQYDHPARRARDFSPEGIAGDRILDKRADHH